MNTATVSVYLVFIYSRTLKLLSKGYIRFEDFEGDFLELPLSSIYRTFLASNEI